MPAPTGAPRRSRRRGDPIARARAWLVEAGADPEELAAMERAARDEMAAARTAAEAAPWPDPAAAFADVQDLGAPTSAEGAAP